MVGHFTQKFRDFAASVRGFWNKSKEALRNIAPVVQTVAPLIGTLIGGHGGGMIGGSIGQGVEIMNKIIQSNGPTRQQGLDFTRDVVERIGNEGGLRKLISQGGGGVRRVVVNTLKDAVPPDLQNVSSKINQAVI
jgi:hypothetical protein